VDLLGEGREEDPQDVQRQGGAAAAKAWRSDASSAVRKGALRAWTPTTLQEAGSAFLDGARSGQVRNKSGRLFKPATVRGYEQVLRDYVLPDLGAVKLGEIRRVDIQDLADRLLARGLDASTVRNALMPVRAIFRRAVSRGDVAVNPTLQLELPAVEGTRDRIADPVEAAMLLEALPASDRALWAAAFFAGLRRGELRALAWEQVDLATGMIHVEHGWDDADGAIDPKSKAGRRRVPIVAALRPHLLEHRLRTGRSGGFVFGRTATSPFTPSNVRKRALTAWKRANAKRQEARLEPLQPIGLHEARHTFATTLIFAGVNVKAISSYMGHASVTVTLDRYGHLMPGHEAEAVEKVDTYLARATGAQAGAQ
jgi:integrase